MNPEIGVTTDDYTEEELADFAVRANEKIAAGMPPREAIIATALESGGKWRKAIGWRLRGNRRSTGRTHRPQSNRHARARRCTRRAPRRIVRRAAGQGRAGSDPDGPPAPPSSRRIHAGVRPC